MTVVPGSAHDPDLHREEVQQLVAVEADRGYAECGEALEKIAGDRGVSRAILRQWRDRNGPSRISVADAMLAPQAVRERMARLLARAAGFELVPIGAAAASKAGCDITTAAEAQGAAGIAIAAALRAMADRFVDRSEAREVRPAIRQAREWLAALDRLFVEAEEKGVAPVRLASVDGSAR